MVGWKWMEIEGGIYDRMGWIGEVLILKDK